MSKSGFWKNQKSPEATDSIYVFSFKFIKSTVLSIFIKTQMVDQHHPHHVCTEERASILMLKHKLKDCYSVSDMIKVILNLVRGF